MQISNKIKLPLAKKARTGWPWDVTPPSMQPSMPDGSPWPRISIITPSYNQGQFIEETIRSVLLQGYPNLEYIIIDGGSTDNSVEIIKKYEPWLAYWISEKDKGQSHAINKGWMRSTGDILAWLNSDDVFQPGVFAEVARLWVENKNIGFIHAQTEMIDGDGLPIGQQWGSPFDLKNSLTTSENCVAQQSTFISRIALQKVGFLDETLEMSMDWDLWVRIGAQYPVKFVPKVWSKIRIWNGTKTQNIGDTSGEEHLRIIKKLFKPGNNVSFDKEVQQKALSRAYERISIIALEKGDLTNFRKNFVNALIAKPFRLSKNMKQLTLPFVLGKNLTKSLSHIKRQIIGFQTK